jgi:hypothetical protein
VEVVFSSPTQDENDVPVGSVVRIQFSRGLNESSIAGGFVVSYTGNAAGSVPFRTAYDFATRSVEIRFEQPLVAFRNVKIETRETLRGFDGAPVTPWALTFSAGG